MADTTFDLKREASKIEATVRGLSARGCKANPKAAALAVGYVRWRASAAEAAGKLDDLEAELKRRGLA